MKIRGLSPATPVWQPMLAVSPAHAQTNQQIEWRANVNDISRLIGRSVNAPP
jgi:hypothetical protein